jgi:hypothetical protein
MESDSSDGGGVGSPCNAFAGEKLSRLPRFPPADAIEKRAVKSRRATHGCRLDSKGAMIGADRLLESRVGGTDSPSEALRKFGRMLQEMTLDRKPPLSKDQTR